MFFKGFNISIQGFSHLNKNIVCQDNSAYYCDDNLAIAIVADGHGGEKYFRSDIGSEIAVRASINSIKEFMNDIDSFDKALNYSSDKVLKKIESNIVCNWNDLINSHFSENPLTESEKLKFPNGELENLKLETIYGSTLIISVITSKYWFGIQIGDGSCVSLYQTGEAKLLIPDDDNLVANFTTSLCDSNAIDNFRHYYSNDLPIALLVSTDGLINSFFDKASFLKFNRRIISQMDDESNINNLREHLYKRSKQGSYDDISISAIYREDIDFESLKL